MCHWNSSSVCVVDGAGKIVCEGKVASEPAALIGYFGSLGLGAVAGRTGGGTFIAVAVRGAAGSGSGGRTVGDAARARCVQGDAGKERPQRRARDCATDAAGLVPSGALQVDCGAGAARHAHGAQADAVEASRHREPACAGFCVALGSRLATPRRGALPGGSGSWWRGKPTLRRSRQRCWRCMRCCCASSTASRSGCGSWRASMAEPDC